MLLRTVEWHIVVISKRRRRYGAKIWLGWVDMTGDGSRGVGHGMREGIVGIVYANADTTVVALIVGVMCPSNGRPLTEIDSFIVS